ncbi:Protein timeless-like protein [Trichoplax sp. H2]|nr:Protein timeless-like protein [Trichoplax sp. H2]|eukprot:RDD45345.1 Protein timeless-like protein [Trichoplax sp. H2]
MDASLAIDGINNELVATISYIGYCEDDQYVLDKDCILTIKDLIRFLRRDDDNQVVRRQLGKSFIIKNDLIPIIKCHWKDAELLSLTIRLMVNLTQPAIVCFDGKIPKKDQNQSRYWLEIEKYLHAYKQAFNDSDLWAILTQQLGKTLQIPVDDRDDDDLLFMERLLLLIRNLLHVPQDDNQENATNSDASLHDQLLWQMHSSGMNDLLIYIASSPHETMWTLHVLEMISLMLRDKSGALLARTEDTKTEKKAGSRQLKVAKDVAEAERRRSEYNISGRHSRFGGSFWVKDMKGISENNIVYHRPLANAKKMSFDCNKSIPRVPKRKLPAVEHARVRESPLAIRLSLKTFCVQFLDYCYNSLMNNVRNKLMHNKSQQNDETYYFKMMKFFMEFNRHKSLQVALISETLSMPIFHFTCQNIYNAYDGLISNKEDSIPWARRMHYVVSAYKELLLNVIAMEQIEDHCLNENAKIIKSNILYMPEFREIPLMLLTKYDPTRQTRSYLTEIITVTHIYLKMIERQCSKNGQVMVKEKKRKMKKKSKKDSASKQLTAEWENLSKEITHTLSTFENLEIFIPALDGVPISELPGAAKEEIRNCLVESRYSEAIATLRICRNKLPDKVEDFGQNNANNEEELLCLKNIYIAKENKAKDISSSEEEDFVLQNGVEKNFNLMNYLKKFTSSKVLRHYVDLLSTYDKNDDSVNHYIVKWFYRIAHDFRMHAMLYQLRLFLIFNKILSEPPLDRYKELVTFVNYILSRFFETTKSNPVVYVETLFWKSAGDCYEITEGYGSLSKEKEERKTKGFWSEEEESKLIELYRKHEDSDDIIGNILSEFVEFSDKGRAQIRRKLLTSGTVTDRDRLRKRKKSAPVPGREFNHESLEEYEIEDQQTDKDADVDVEELHDLINDVITTVNKEVIDAVVQCLQFAITTRKQGENQDEIDLESIITNNEEIFKSAVTQELLYFIGFLSRFDEDDIIWYIPSSYSTKKLESLKSTIIQELDNINSKNINPIEKREIIEEINFPKSFMSDDSSSNEEEMEDDVNTIKRDASNDSDNERIMMKRKKKLRQILDSDDDD